MILHVDMDAFYASVEVLDNPQLAGKCVIVGGRSRRAVVSAASYEARKFGVRSAMPVFEARRLCPEGVFVPPRMHRYKEISDQVMAILEEFTPLVEPVSIDEAFLDVTGCTSLCGTPVQIGKEVKQRIRDRLHLTCSVGVAPSKFLAKIASDMKKPDGLFVVAPESVESFLEGLPVTRAPGVGKSTYRILESIGIHTFGDVKRYPQSLLVRHLGRYGQRLWELARGIDISPVTPVHEHKSTSCECTLETDVDDVQVLKKILLGQAEEVARELRRLEVKARTVVLKIKHADFKQVTRSVTLACPSRTSSVLFKEAARLLDLYGLDRKVRLVGLGASGLVSATTPVQMEMFGTASEAGKDWERVDRTLDTIRDRFGKEAVRRAVFSGKGKEDSEKKKL